MILFYIAFNLLFWRLSIHIHICSQTSFSNVLIFNKNEPWKSLDSICDTIFLSSAKVRKRKYTEGFCSVPKLSSCYLSCSFPTTGHIQVKVSVKKSSCYLVFPSLGSALDTIVQNSTHTVEVTRLWLFLWINIIMSQKRKQWKSEKR